MNFSEEIIMLLSSNAPEGQELEYKSVLPPARSIGQIISGFANTSGGVIILGVNNAGGKIEINGLSEDFNANGVTHKAIDMLVPKPFVNYQYVSYKGKKVYALKIEKSKEPILFEGKIHLRDGVKTVLKEP